MASRDALIVTAHFPPSNSVAMFRPTKFAKYLPDHGWSSHVFTRYPLDYSADTNEDQTAADRCQSIEYCEEWYPVSNVNDDGLRWAMKMLPRLVRKVETADTDVVYYTGKPFLPFVLAPLVKRYTGVPYVLDLRDPWSLSAYWSDTPISKAYQRVSSVAEQFTFRYASAVVCATGTMTDQYGDEYPQFASKLSTIPNGFDPDDYTGFSPVATDEFTVTYIGKFASFRDPEPFLDAFRELVAANPDSQFLHIGSREEHVVEAVRERGLTDHFRCTGYLPREEAIPLVAGSDVGLVVTNRTEALTTKVFDYIACDIPILGIGPANGEMRQLVDTFEHGYTCDETAVGQTLHELYTARPTHLDDDATRQQYSRKVTAAQLVDVFESVV